MYCDGPTPLFQEELELEDIPLLMYCPNWEPGDQLFLTHIFPELTQADLQAMAMISQHLVEGARRSKETHATTALLPAYIVEF